LIGGSKYTSGLCSICSVSYNHGAFIEAAVESVWQQDYENIEIVIVDDGSTDNTRDILIKMQKVSPCPMKLVFQEHTGVVSKNADIAMLNASGEFVTIVPTDDVLINNSILSSEIALLNQDDGSVFAIGNGYKEIDDLGVETSEVCNYKIFDGGVVPSPEELLEAEYNTLNTFMLQACVMRHDFIDAIGGHDEDMMADDIVLRTKMFKYLIDNPQYKYSIYNAPTFFYRVHRNNLHKNTYRQVKSVHMYLDKYFPDRQIPDLLVKWCFYGVLRCFKRCKIIDAFKFFFISKKLSFALFSKRGLSLVVEKLLGCK